MREELEMCVYGLDVLKDGDWEVLLVMVLLLDWLEIENMVLDVMSEEFLRRLAVESMEASRALTRSLLGF